MNTRIVQIGNSQGIRIPKPLLEQAGLRGDIELTVADGSNVIRPLKKPREGWLRTFREVARQGEDAMLDDAVPTNWDNNEWQW